jgi:glycosyltransferase involved in cell wall biosynthesis
LAFAATRLSRLPYVITVQLGDVPGAIPEQTDTLFRWLNPLIRPIWRQAAAVVAVSRFVADLAQKAYRLQPTIIPNGISLSGRPGTPKSTTTIPRLIFVGRLNPQKNLHYLPSVLAALRELPWDFDIVGDGVERRALESAFADVDLSGRVHFHGWLDRPIVENKLGNAEIFIFPSFVEGLPVAVLEAMKFGLLLVGSDIPTLHECVTSGDNGYLLSLHAPVQWIEKLKTLLSDANLRLVMRRRSWEMAERFDLEQIANQYEILFRRIASETQRATSP